MGSVSTSIRGVRFTLYTLDGNEWVRFPRHSVSGSILLGLTWDSWCGKGTAPGCAWCLRGAMLLRGFAFLAWPCTGSPKVPSGVCNLPAFLHCPGMECMEDIFAGWICQSQTFDHPGYTATDCGDHPASACTASPSHMGYCSSPNFQVLSSTRQVAVIASLFSSFCDSIHPRRNQGHRCTWFLGGIVHGIGNPQSAQ